MEITALDPCFFPAYYLQTIKNPKGKPMTTKERIKAAINSEPVDRLPFWPKIGGAYAIKWKKTADELYEYIGSDPIAFTGPVYKESRAKTRHEVKTFGIETVTEYVTAHGTLRRVCRFDEASQSEHPMEFPIKTRHDIEIMAEWFKDIKIEYDKSFRESCEAHYKSIGNAAFVAATVGSSALMHFVEWLAGVEQAHYFLADYPEETEALFAEMHRVTIEKTAVSAQYSPADALFFIEDTSTAIISPGQYKRCNFDHLKRYGEISKSFCKPVILHMCGHLKALLPMLAELPVNAFEAFTSPTMGDTTLLDGRNACPDKCLIGGTNAAVWLGGADEIFRHISNQLDKLPHRRGIFISSAGMMPPDCPPETVRVVKRRLD
ncbi:MAG: uroporphyrinogen decarboxylase family protein [Defluviitaleaceae bacterium]|nr:uroporphyrinogen decarboxylase family protein [Defluviitaleaceae bacterium]